ncbi:MAG: transglycosylase family protein [Propionicimonas sp.]|uniref:transglycosylase family protein n=1 Tax=Propionicimonas sp. TaxID=1955623 RepID=UPI003D14BE38
MNKAITATALSAVLLAGGVSTAASLYKDVQLTVDGQVLEADGFALTVADVLAAKGVTLTASDEVSPAVDSAVTSGQVVTVRYGKQLTLNVDGAPRTFLTHAATLDEALSTDAITSQATQLAVTTPRVSLVGARTSIPLDATLPRSGVTVDVTTPKHVELVVGGHSTEVVTTAATVADLLNEQDLTVGATDRLDPLTTTAVTEDQTITLDRVVVSKKTKTETVPFDTISKNNSSLWKGESRVLTAGKNGKAKRTYEITVVNGKVTKKVVVSETVITKATDQVTEVGTKTSANGVGINLARAAMWDRIARCESGGNWHINTGNGYYGGLQFNMAAWNSNGGRDFAARADLASRAQQITVANRYYAKAGTSPWTCA